MSFSSVPLQLLQTPHVQLFQTPPTFQAPVLVQRALPTASGEGTLPGKSWTSWFPGKMKDPKGEEGEEPRVPVSPWRLLPAHKSHVPGSQNGMSPVDGTWARWRETWEKFPSACLWGISTSVMPLPRHSPHHGDLVVHPKDVIFQVWPQGRVNRKGSRLCKEESPKNLGRSLPQAIYSWTLVNGKSCIVRACTMFIPVASHNWEKKKKQREWHKYSRHTFALYAPFMPDEKAGNVNTKKGSMLKRLKLSSETIEILTPRTGRKGSFFSEVRQYHFLPSSRSKHSWQI